MAEKTITKKQRQEAEALIYKFFDTLDKTKTNSNHYKEMFADMTDAQFLKFISKNFPYRFHQRPFEIEPTMSDACDACEKVLHVPVFETVYLPYQYINKDGKSVETEREQLVIYITLKKMQQFLTHKNSMSTDISNRNMKTGELLSEDKNGKSSDRELQGMVVLGLDNTVEEFSKAKADSMEAKNLMYNTISTKGEVSIDDIKTDIDDSLSRNMMNVYLLGANIKSNVISDDYMLPYTYKNKNREIKTI